MKTLLDVIYYTTAAIVVYQILRACWHWFKLFTLFMFDEGLSEYKPKLEKPRLFFHLITVTFSVIAYVQLGKPTFNPDVFVFLQFFYLIVVAFFGVMFQITWCEIFESRFIPSVKKTLNKSSSDFKSNYQYEEVITIYRSLISNGYLIYEDVNVQLNMEKQFVEILLKGVLPEKPLFSLQMNYHQIDVVYERMLSRISQFPWDYFLRIFTDFKGDINLPALQASASRAKKKMIIKKKNQYAREQSIIESIFLSTPKYS